MVDPEDVQGYASKFENQLEKLDEASIDDRDREAIHAFVRAVDARGDVNRGTIGTNLNRLRLASERADVPLVEMDKADVDELVFSLRHDHDLSDGTIRNYRKALRKFFDGRDEEWAEDVKIGASPPRSVGPNELLTDDELDAILEAASNPRDKALIAMLADTGLRISGVATLRVRDLDQTGQTTLVTINEDAHVKGASGTVPLTWSDGYLASWLQIHPRRDVDDAALIHKLDGYGADDAGALSYGYLSARIKDVADDAGVDRDRVNTHNFRKTAISNWIREGLSEQAIKHRATWDVDTDMIQIYSGVRDEELNDQILAHYDIATEASDTGPTIDACPRCGTAVEAFHSYCPGCTAPLDQVAAEALDDAETSVMSSKGITDDPDVDETLDRFFAAIKNDPEAKAAAAEKANELLD